MISGTCRTHESGWIYGMAINLSVLKVRQASAVQSLSNIDYTVPVYYSTVHSLYSIDLP